MTDTLETTPQRGAVAGLTQDELASMETSRTVIESGRSLPSTRTLQRLAAATGSRLRITLDPPETRPVKKRERATHSKEA